MGPTQKTAARRLPKLPKSVRAAPVTADQNGSLASSLFSSALSKMAEDKRSFFLSASSNQKRKNQ